MNKIAITLVILFTLITFFCFYGLTPNYIIQIHREHSFVVDQNFTNVRLALFKRDLLKEILISHKAELIEQHYIKKEFSIKKISHPLQTWRYHAVIIAKARLQEPAKENLGIRCKIWAEPECIHSIASLEHPLKIGITKWDETIHFSPYGEKTLIQIKLDVELCRVVPRNWRQYAWNEVSTTADDTIVNFEKAIRDLLR